MAGLAARVRARRGVPPAVLDIAVIVMAVTVDLVLFWNHNGSDTPRVPAVVLPLYDLAGAVALVWRRRAPLAVFAVLWLHSVAGLLLPDFYPTMGLLVALYSVATYVPSRLTALAIPVVFVPNLAIVQEEARSARHTGHVQAFIVTSMVYMLINSAAWGLGRWQSHGRRRIADLERQREEEARRAIARERTRIAQELHDIISHAVTVIVLQAAGARRIARQDLRRTEQALEAIEDSGKQAMSELRRMLNLLRTDDEAEETCRERAARHGLDELDDLLDGFRQLGMSVVLERRGEPRRLDRSVDLAAYRVVAEGLTNATKHAGQGSQVAVRLEWSAELLAVSVVDDGGGAPIAGSAQALSTGHGLLGLGERVAVVGGRLEASRAAGGGFQVTAEFPVVTAQVT